MSFFSSGGRKQWSNTLNFIVYENHNYRKYELQNEEAALDHFIKLGHDDERILWAKILKHSLHWFLPVPGNWHEFVIVKSTNYYWSFEKNTSGIYIQRSKEIADVRNMLVGRNRAAKVLPEGRSNFDVRFGENISDIIKWIINMKELDNTYHLMERNCHSFASELYKAVVRADNRRLDDQRSDCF